jgi:hypothetical protein
LRFSLLCIGSVAAHNSSHLYSPCSTPPTPTHPPTPARHGRRHLHPPHPSHGLHRAPLRRDGQRATRRHRPVRRRRRERGHDQAARSGHVPTVDGGGDWTGGHPESTGYCAVNVRTHTQAHARRHIHTCGRGYDKTACTQHTHAHTLTHTQTHTCTPHTHARARRRKILKRRR